MLLAGGLALPEDMLVMKFSGSVYELRRAKVRDAVRNAAGRPPMRLIAGRKWLAPSRKAHLRPPHRCGPQLVNCFQLLGGRPSLTPWRAIPMAVAGPDLGIGAFFLLRDDRRDLLWSLATHCEESTKQNLAATPNRYSPTPSSINVASTCSSAPHRC
jgi:hypothetical protein